MDWLRKHWKGASWLAGAICTAIVGKIVDHYFDVSILATLWGLVVSCWALVTTSVPVPLWFLVALVIAVLMYVIAIVKQLRASSTKLRLNEDQQHILHFIGACNTQRGAEPTLQEIADATKRTSAVTGRITDQLCALRMLTWRLRLNTSRWSLGPMQEHGAVMTDLGRNYLLDSGVDPSDPEHNG